MTMAIGLKGGARPVKYHEDKPKRDNITFENLNRKELKILIKILKKSNNQAALDLIKQYKQLNK